MALTEQLKVNITEKQTFNITLIEKEIFEVNFSVVDRIGGVKKYLSELLDTTIISPLTDQILVWENGYWVNKEINVIIDSYAVQNETVNPLPPVTAGDPYTTTHAFRTESLEVFLNGLKLLSSDVTIISDTKFSLPIDTVITDSVIVNYIKKS